MNLEHWESYYQGGAIATGPTGNLGNYDQELKSVWQAFLEAVPPQGVILDLGTGNGAVALIAKELSDSLRRDWVIHGTDLARIDPPARVRDGQRRFAGVSFHPGVASEDLPFDAATFDAICGQYALEYADLSRAVPEVARVLKPGGQAQFVIHHDQSLLAENARQSLLQGSLVLQVTGVYDALRRVVKPADRSAESVAEATTAFRAAMRRLGRAQTQFPGGSDVLGVTLAALRELLALRAGQPEAVVLSEIDRVEADLRLSLRRLEDLLERASDEAAIDSMIRLAEAHGLQCRMKQLQYHAGDNLVGWRVQWVRGAV
jgi:SAM-dependent methyltransferase